MKHITSILIALFMITACNSENASPPATGDKIKITVGTSTFTATLYENNTADAFKSMLPITVHMNDLHRNEKYYDFPNSLPSSSSRPKYINNGDLMLFGSRTLVLFYKSFSTSYSYTRIGKFDNPSGLQPALGSGSVTVTFEKL